MAPRPAEPHHPGGRSRNQEIVSNALDLADGVAACPLFVSDLLMQEKHFWGYGNRPEDMQCSPIKTETRSHRKSGLQCRKLRDLQDRPWFPIITLVAWHLAHLGTGLAQCEALLASFSGPLKGRWKPDTSGVESQGRGAEAPLPADDTEGTLPYKKVSKGATSSSRPLLQANPVTYLILLLNKKQEIGGKNKRKERTQQLRKSQNNNNQAVNQV